MSPQQQATTASSTDSGDARETPTTYNTPARASTKTRAGPSSEPLDECPECEGDLVHRELEQRCTACGLVVARDAVDRRGEWRFADSEGNGPLRRCNGGTYNHTLHDGGLGSGISWNHKSPKFQRLRRWHKRAKQPTKIARNRASAFGEIKRIGSALELPESVVERSCRIFAMYHEAGGLKGDSIDLLVGAAVFAACREHEVIRLPAEIAEAMCVTRDADHHESGDSSVRDLLLRRYSALCRELSLRPRPPSAVDHVPHGAEQLGTDRATRVHALRLAERLEDEQIAVGKSPSAVAAGCLYVAEQATPGESATQEAVADALAVSIVTIRNRQKDVVELPDVAADGTFVDHETPARAETVGSPAVATDGGTDTDSRGA